MNAHPFMHTGAIRTAETKDSSIPQFFDRNLRHVDLLGRTDRQKQVRYPAKQSLIIQFGPQHLIHHTRISLSP